MKTLKFSKILPTKLITEISSAILTGLGLLNAKQRRKFYLYSIAQIILGFLDLFGVLILGGLGALMIQGVESKKAGNRVSILLRNLGIQNLNFQHQIALLGILATLVLLGKSIFSIIFSKKLLHFMSSNSATITTSLIKKVLTQNIEYFKNVNSQELIFILNNGVNSLFTGVMSLAVNVISDVFLTILLFSGLLAVDPIMALSTILTFGIIAATLHKLLGARSRHLSMELGRISVKFNNKTIEIINNIREIIIHSRQSAYLKDMSDLQNNKSYFSAEQTFQPLISKYAIEIVTIFSLLLFGTYEFTTKNAIHATATIAVFLAASSRIAPSTLRFQQNLMTIQANLVISQKVKELLSEFQTTTDAITTPYNSKFDYKGFESKIIIDNVTFGYKDSEKPIFKNMSLTIPQGKIVGIVGPSGSGKTSLVDLILGVLEPVNGKVLISGVSPRIAAAKWSGAISYVPQNVFIKEGTILENVILGYDYDPSDEIRVWGALQKSQLESWVKSLSEGLNTQVGEFGSRLSGGQKQRLGIARALYTSPKLIVLDEATSSLDAQTEFQIKDVFSNIAQDTTLIIIAHRLSTVVSAHELIYLESGEIKATGTFAEIRAKIPNFESQAKLMGL